MESRAFNSIFNSITSEEAGVIWLAGGLGEEESKVGEEELIAVCSHIEDRIAPFSEP